VDNNSQLSLEGKANDKKNSKSTLDKAFVCMKDAITTSKIRASKSCPIHVDLKPTRRGRASNDLQNV